MFADNSLKSKKFTIIDWANGIMHHNARGSFLT